jgi:hypothetical protein
VGRHRRDPIATQGPLARVLIAGCSTSCSTRRCPSEELADLAIERLKESIDAGGHELPVDERRLSRARRAVEKAIGILREPDDLD